MDDAEGSAMVDAVSREAERPYGNTLTVTKWPFRCTPTLPMQLFNIISRAAATGDALLLRLPVLIGQRVFRFHPLSLSLSLSLSLFSFSLTTSNSNFNE
jgi:hypothetical protein